MDIEYYEKTLGQLIEAQMVNESLDDIEKGNLIDGETAFKQLKEKYGF